LSLVGETHSAEEIMAVVERDLPFYEASSGGMTLSGGEPLAQLAGAGALLRLARERSIHTAVETCGCVPWRDIEPLLALVDLWLYDVKHIDPVAHRMLTGRSNRRILLNLHRLVMSGARVVLRVPVIPGRNAARDAMERLAQWAACQGRLEEVDLLPYSRLAESKYETIGRKYDLKGLPVPSDEELGAIKKLFEARGLLVHIGG
jgi:pyruvate formate lyase activating enzyme